MNTKKGSNIYDETADPKIVKLARLILILMDKNVDKATKVGCTKLAILNKTITQNEAVDLLMYMPELRDFITE